MVNYPSLDSSIHPSPSIHLHPSLSIRPSIHLNPLVIANRQLSKIQNIDTEPYILISNINTAYLGLLLRAMQITPLSACPAPEINIDTEY